MKYLIYLSQVANKVAIDFELWAVYESSLIEALAGLLIYQFLEDLIFHIFKQKEYSNPPQLALACVP
ncbi:hypothetical protein [Gloeomargarita lithophora]|uniref:hypothetical protein n=1 Tax=Gloeomargarita lithophora TaxID=1188228 RepID=UPI0008F9076C|nr:hypothetical protein [Gloeomargarita lithophora]